MLLGAPVGDRLSMSKEPRSRLESQVAETQGFEPWIPLTGYDDLANRCLQPLGHVSGATGFALAAGERQ
jgi:hypothetical protein